MNGDGIVPCSDDMTWVAASGGIRDGIGDALGIVGDDDGRGNGSIGIGKGKSHIHDVFLWL